MNLLYPNLFACTLTGIDAGVDLSELWALSAQNTLVEWGVLLSHGRAGAGRYPPLAWIRDLAQEIRARPGPRIAVHVCGEAVDHLLAGDQRLIDLLQPFHRVQLNLRQRRDTAMQLRFLLQALPHWDFITQSNAANAGLWQAVRDLPGHQILFDSSGGCGKLPQVWPDAPQGADAPLVGYAGGLGPDNLRQQLPAIARAAGGRPFWVDMETRLRSASDRFDMGLARRTLLELDLALAPPTSTFATILTPATT